MLLIFFNNTLQKFTSDGIFLDSVDIRGDGPLRGNLTGVGYNKMNGKIYVSCNHKVVVLNTYLSYHTTLGKYGKNAGEFDTPRGVSFDRAGNVYVADNWNNQVQVFSADGEFIRKLDNCDRPVGIAIGPCTGVIYVTEEDRNRISLFTAAGELMGSFGNSYTEYGLYSPAGIVIDKDENIIVADLRNNRVLIL